MNAVGPQEGRSQERRRRRGSVSSVWTRNAKRLGAATKEFFYIPPTRGQHLVATRMFIGLAIPSLLLLLAGHPELVIYAAFGCFTGMYGRGEPHQLRLFHQLSAGLFLCSCVLAGILFSASPLGLWAFVAVETLLAGLASVVTDRLRLRPIGPFFGIFAFGACAATPLTAAPWIPAGVAVLAAACAMGVGFAGWFRVRIWRPGHRRSAILDPPRPLRRDLATGAMYMLSVGLAGALAAAMGWGHPYWAMASAAVPLSAVGLAGGMGRGFHRVIGTYAGLLVATCALAASTHPAVLVLLVIAFQFPTELYIVRHYALSLVFFTPLILAMTYLANPGSIRNLVVDRAAQTTIGAAVGMLTLFAFSYSTRPRTGHPAP